MEKATGLRKVAHQSAVRAPHGPYCSHTEGHFSYIIRRPHSDLVNSLGRHGRSVVAVLCDGGITGEFPAQRASNAENDSI